MPDDRADVGAHDRIRADAPTITPVISAYGSRRINILVPHKKAQDKRFRDLTDDIARKGLHAQVL